MDGCRDQKRCPTKALWTLLGMLQERELHLISTPLRAVLRGVGLGCLGLVMASALAVPAIAADPEQVLPDTTLFFFKVKNASEFRESFKSSGMGQLLADPDLKPLKEDIIAKLADSSKQIKAALGVTLGELATLPQGAITAAVVPKNDPKIPFAILLSADAGKNASTMSDLMNKANEPAQKANAKVATETFKGVTIHIIQPPAEGDKPSPPLIWTNVGTVFHIATDLDALKDVLSHAEGRSDSLEKVDSFAKTRKKLGDAPVSWFLDITKTIKLLVKAGQAAQPALQNVDTYLQITGINGLKAASGSFSFNVGAYDTVSKVYFLAPAPSQGLLKMFMMPQVSLTPEPWVPSTVASYSSFSWDIDGAYTAINDLVNQFNPGMLQQLQGALVGPNGGDPLDFQKDIFGPLGNRITVISDFKKPIKEDSQRMLVGVNLTDSKKFLATFNKLIDIAGGTPAKREFLGTTIYDFKMPEVPNPAGGADGAIKAGTVSLAIAKDTLFISTEPTLLESILRGGSSPLADSPEYVAFSKQVPGKSSSQSYAKPNESFRALYDSIKSGDFEKQANPRGGNMDLSKVFDKSKLPDFSVFAKYISSSGGFGLMEDDGVTFTNFNLRKAQP